VASGATTPAEEKDAALEERLGREAPGVDDAVGRGEREDEGEEAVKIDSFEND
jgi:hypothetical protein